VSQIIDLDPDETMSALSFSGMNEAQKAFESGQPLVFLNACEVGRLSPSLVGSAGFASACIRLGACAVIAPIWSVKDTIAYEVARSFYAAVKADPRTPYGEIVRQLRAHAYQGDALEDSYAAYCYYGDPLAASAP
jgi:hypothetical protein